MLYKWNKKQIDYTQAHHLKIKKIDLEQRLEEKINDVNNHIINIKEKITYRKDKNNKSKKK